MRYDGAMHFVLALLLVIAWPHRAQACSFEVSRKLELDPAEQAVDRTAPGDVVPGAVSIKRGVGPRSEGCDGQMATSCDDLGQLVIGLTAPTDDRTPGTKLGYRVRLVGGALPPGLTLPTEPVTAVERSGGLVFVWIDGATDEQEEISFDITVTAVDLAGNESGKAVGVHVGDPGAEASGCQVGRRSAAPTFVLALVAARLVSRRSGRLRR